ncbi:uncharacterized protein ASCRUDRAFT_5626 [Ascoidea rubescens DSM 1968]|uniref:diacylglycerol O-acyltransferase n=1 Tax=Ascoidea rubescens DSM 1968 TaxID=1344418 RepID=A0A1D2VQ43_9ASCO|nr:hypothetical protein ASCRUDRAFT_5626 [Ascoidea rubescens DSM 1968]ODV63675.1 hypothetical protein ASCRUDRAFT_5626 [Ascoidea rubescens DSM 1968]
MSLRVPNDSRHINTHRRRTTTNFNDLDEELIMLARKPSLSNKKKNLNNILVPQIRLPNLNSIPPSPIFQFDNIDLNPKNDINNMNNETNHNNNINTNNNTNNNNTNDNTNDNININNNINNLKNVNFNNLNNKSQSSNSPSKLHINTNLDSSFDSNTSFISTSTNKKNTINPNNINNNINNNNNNNSLNLINSTIESPNSSINSAYTPNSYNSLLPRSKSHSRSKSISFHSRSKSLAINTSSNLDSLNNHSKLRNLKNPLKNNIINSDLNNDTAINNSINNNNITHNIINENADTDNDNDNGILDHNNNNNINNNSNKININIKTIDSISKNTRINSDANDLNINSKSINNSNLKNRIINSPITSYEEIQHLYSHCYPIHVISKHSILSLIKYSSDSSTNQNQNQNSNQNQNQNQNQSQNLNSNSVKVLSLFGLRNLCMMLFFITNIKSVFYYVLSINYFHLLSPIKLISHHLKYNTDIRCFLFIIFFLTPLSFFFSLLIEKLAFYLTKRKFNSLTRHSMDNNLQSNFPNTNSLLSINYLSSFTNLLHFLNSFNHFIFANYITSEYVWNPLVGVIIEITSIVLFFKLISYSLTNNDLRHLYFRSINPQKYNSYLIELEKERRQEPIIIDPSKLSEVYNKANNHKKDNQLNNNNLKNSHDINSSIPSNFLKDGLDFIDYHLQPNFYKTNFYPKNLSIKSTFFYMFVPTLVYQPVYPMNPLFDIHYCLNKIYEIIIISASIYLLSNRYYFPLMKDSILKIFSYSSIPSPSSNSSFSINHLDIIEKIIHLTDVSIVCWILVYFMVFHTFLNLVAEITKFGDREFYSQWWNSKSTQSYWKTWNKLFSNFFYRHISRPISISTINKRNWSKLKINLLIYIIGGILQEILIGVPTHTFLGIGFISVILQLPLSILTAPLENLERNFIGNFVFWIGFILGQPLIVMLYYVIWNIKYYGEEVINFQL